LFQILRAWKDGIKLKHVSAQLDTWAILSNKDSFVENDNDFTCSYHWHTKGCHMKKLLFVHFVFILYFSV